MNLSIIIVNHNTADLLMACLASVLKQKNIQAEIIVIDNASTDHSRSSLKTYQNQITLLENPENVGFGRAMNRAIKHSKGKYLLLFNPDAQFVQDTGIYKLLEYMNNNLDIGLASPVVLKNNTATLPRSEYPGQKYSAFDFTKLPGSIAWVLGACMILRREVYEQTDGFDEDFFLYGEETEWCLRIRKAGWKIGYYDQVIVDHIGGASQAAVSIENLWRKKQRGLHLFYKKAYLPNEIKKIIQSDLKQAKFKLILLKLKKLIGMAKKNDTHKIIRQQTIIETSKQFLLVDYVQ